MCMDGYFCNAVTDPMGYACCNSHGGRALCPANFPVMCDAKECGIAKDPITGDESDGDFCCEASPYYCKALYGGPPKYCYMGKSLSVS